MHFLSLPRTLRLDFPARLRGNVWGMIDLEISREFFPPFFRPPIVRAVRKKKENPRGEKRKYVKGELFFGIIKAIFRYRVSTVWKGSTGVPFPILELSSPENCPSSWLQFPDTLFRYFENFFETVTERGNAVPRNWTFSPEHFRSRARSLRFPRGVEEFRRSGPRPVRERLPSGYEYSFYRVLFRGAGEDLHRRFSMDFFFPLPIRATWFRRSSKISSPEYPVNFCEKSSRRQTTVYDNDHSFWLLTPCAEYLRKPSYTESSSRTFSASENSWIRKEKKESPPFFSIFKIIKQDLIYNRR